MSGFDLEGRDGLFIPANDQPYLAHCLIEMSEVGELFRKVTLSDGRVVHVEMHSAPSSVVFDGTVLFKPRV